MKKDTKKMIEVYLEVLESNTELGLYDTASLVTMGKLSALDDLGLISHDEYRHYLTVIINMEYGKENATCEK